MTTKKCLCCGIGSVDAQKGSYDICSVCGWEDDDVEGDESTFFGGANFFSLNDHLELWKLTGKKNWKQGDIRKYEDIARDIFHEESTYYKEAKNGKNEDDAYKNAVEKVKDLIEKEEK
ncbi:hypothetical protein FWF74_02625 [Candidatus Saccharibacteria bacterium]|nr:hypothetical protein [Candidatus Saccharibacteria bacterium]MCL1962721.1 hypothetical protein [Candidatus Saccharibacteria bacterium]